MGDMADWINDQPPTSEDPLTTEEEERLPEWVETQLARNQPCGCVLCVCGDVDRCHGCGATACEKHREAWEQYPLIAENARLREDAARWKQRYFTSIEKAAGPNERRDRMIKVAINKCYGGFSISEKVIEELRRLGAHKGMLEEYCLIDGDEEKEAGFERPGEIGYRSHPLLIQALENLSEEEDRDNDCAEIKIVEIPDDVEVYIQDYDGNEWIAEKHRTWH
jgi:hypothetical protein